MNLSQSGGHQLVLRARQGDAQALGQLLEQHRGYLKVLAQRVLIGKSGTHLDATEAVQRTCEVVHQSIGEFQGETPSQFLAWLRQIHEVCLNNPESAVQQQKSTSQADSSGPAPSTAAAPSLEQTILHDHRQTQLAAGMTGLPALQQEAMHLRYEEGKTVSQIAAALNCTDQAAASLIYRALLALRQRQDLNPSNS